MTDNVYDQAAEFLLANPGRAAIQEARVWIALHLAEINLEGQTLSGLRVVTQASGLDRAVVTRVLPNSKGRSSAFGSIVCDGEGNNDLVTPTDAGFVGVRGTRWSPRSISNRKSLAPVDLFDGIVGRTRSTTSKDKKEIDTVAPYGWKSIAPQMSAQRGLRTDGRNPALDPWTAGKAGSNGWALAVMTGLGQTQDMITTSEIATMLGITPASARKTVQSLVENGLAIRKDKGQVWLHFTLVKDLPGDLDRLDSRALRMVAHHRSDSARVNDLPGFSRARNFKRICQGILDQAAVDEVELPADGIERLQQVISQPWMTTIEALREPEKDRTWFSVSQCRTSGSSPAAVDPEPATTPEQEAAMQREINAMRERIRAGA